jgi:hypothetical protein
MPKEKQTAEILKIIPGLIENIEFIYLFVVLLFLIADFLLHQAERIDDWKGNMPLPEQYICFLNRQLFC